MGTFEHKALGEVKGKVGNVIGRKRKNKFFIYAAPTEVKISNSPAAVNSRNIMNPLSKFASVVNKIPELKYLWLKRGIETFDVFHKIEKENYQFAIPERPTINNFITPLWSNRNPITDGSVSEAGIKLKADIVGESVKQFREAEEILGTGVICYYDPVEVEKEYFHLSRLDTIAFDVPNEGEFEIKFEFSEGERRNYNSYKKSILYYTLVLKDGDGVPIACTVNFQKEIVREDLPVEESATQSGEIFREKNLGKESVVESEGIIKEKPLEKESVEREENINEKTLVRENLITRNEIISDRYLIREDLPSRAPHLRIFE